MAFRIAEPAANRVRGSNLGFDGHLHSRAGQIRRAPRVEIGTLLRLLDHRFLQGARGSDRCSQDDQQMVLFLCFAKKILKETDLRMTLAINCTRFS
jgi:hypothetical protein